MEKELFRKNALSMIELVICSLNGEKPDPALIESLDLNALFKVCQEHILTACVAYALESAGIRDNNFLQAKEKAIRKNILMDAERRKILVRLEQEHIWYMPLKGSIIKDWYPKLGMRQMSDNDILCDNAYRSKIKDIMLDMGFTCKHFGFGNDDTYVKPPVCSFEMHNELFNLTHGGCLHEYYDNVKSRLLKNEADEYGYHFSTEDFYIYMIAHEYGHFSSGGTGVRSLIDTYIFLDKWGAEMDWSSIRNELRKLDIVEFEEQNRVLSQKLCTRQALDASEQKLLDYYILSGIYGNLENHVSNAMEKKNTNSRAKYIFRRIFPTNDELKVNWNFFYRHKYLLPALWIYRPIHGLFTHSRQLRAEMKYVLKNKRNREE